MMYLEKANEIGENESVEFGQSVNDSDGPVGICAVLDAFLVKLVRDETLVEFTVPKFE